MPPLLGSVPAALTKRRSVYPGCLSLFHLFHRTTSLDWSSLSDALKSTAHWRTRNWSPQSSWWKQTFRDCSIQCEPWSQLLHSRILFLYLSKVYCEDHWLIFFNMLHQTFSASLNDPSKDCKSMLLEDASFGNLEEEFKRMEQRGLNISYHPN